MSALPAPVREAIRARRNELQIKQGAGGVSPATWGAIENGRTQGSALVRASICKALGWTTDSIDRLAAGQQAKVDTPRHADGETMGDAVQALAAAVTRLNDEIAAQRILIDRLVAAELARRQ